jgi:peptidyl-tRNA hydrolase, PTH1 family
MSGKYLIVGLGNLGRDYIKTRHNVGFWVIDELARRHNLGNFTKERKALVSSGRIKGKSVILAKPQTYMNLSGEAVRALVDYYKIGLENFIVVSDHLDLPLGTLRMRNTGGHGGQNGVRNIILHLGTQDFARVRFGISRPPGKMKPSDYVLHKFIGDDIILAQQVMESAANAVEHWLEEGIQLVMTRYNGDITENGTKGKKEKVDPKKQLPIVIRAHELNPKDPKPLQEMVKLYKRLRQLDDAARTHLLLAEIYGEQGKNKKMLHQWEMAVKTRPMLIEVQEEIAREYEAQENNKRATQAWIKLAEYHEREGDTKSALKVLTEALRINPQHSKALELQVKYQNKLTM